MKLNNDTYTRIWVNEKQIINLLEGLTIVRFIEHLEIWLKSKHVTN